jgi:hypothetical protein
MQPRRAEEGYEGDKLPPDGLPVAEELVIFVVAAVPAADLGEVRDELDTLDPLHLLEAELDLIAQP